MSANMKQTVPVFTAKSVGFRERRTRRARESIITGLLFLCALVSVFTTVAIVFTLIQETVAFFFDVSFLEFITGTRWTPLFEPQHFGVLPLLSGTMLVAAIGCVLALPAGLLTAIFLSEYAPQWLRRILKPVLEILAGIPTVVLGFFALHFISQDIVTKLFDQAIIFNALSAGIAIGIMVIPLVASVSEDAMEAVPNSLREGAYALGSTKFEVVRKVVVPAALSGVMASFILAFSRAVGETMIVALAAGGTPNLTWNPVEAVQTMTAYIVQVSLGDTEQGGIEYESIFAVGMSLFVMTLGLNVLSLYLLRRFREVYE